MLVLHAATYMPLLAPRLGRARFRVRPGSHPRYRTDAYPKLLSAQACGLAGVCMVCLAPWLRFCTMLKQLCRASSEAAKLRRWVQDGVGLQGAQAEYVRVPLADATLVPVPEGVSDEQARPVSGLAQGPHPQPIPCRRASATSRRARPQGWHRALIPNLFPAEGVSDEQARPASGLAQGPAHSAAVPSPGCRIWWCMRGSGRRCCAASCRRLASSARSAAA